MSRIVALAIGLLAIALFACGGCAVGRPLPDVVVAGGEATTSVELPCGDLVCRGSLFLPERGEAPYPTIVMAHGLTLTREYLARHARRFADAGFAVLSFDYRSFGGSEGSPRYDVSAPRQLEDWRAAIAYVSRRDDLDASRLALWGSSYSGGHVLVLASEATEARAVVAQVPYVGASVDDEPGTWFFAKVVGALALDGVLRAVGRAFYVDVAGEPGDLAGITIAEEKAALDRFIASVPDSNWRNQMPARVLYRVGTYVPDIRPEAIACPVRLYAARSDRITPAAAVEALATRIPRAELSIEDGGHFEIYEDPRWSRVVTEQIAFYRRHLLGSE